MQTQYTLYKQMQTQCKHNIHYTNKCKHNANIMQTQYTLHKHNTHYTNTIYIIQTQEK